VSGGRRPGLLVASLQLASVAYLAAVGGLLWWSHAPMLVGWQPKVVLTGSMLPVIRPGDVALIGPAEGALPAGRVVLVDDASRESGTYLHRVVRYEDDGRLVTKGDANATEDHPAVDPARVQGQLRLLVPVVGRPVVWLHDHRYLLLGGSLAVTWAAMAFALALRGQRDDEPAPRAFGAAFGADEDDSARGFDGRGFDGRGFDGRGFDGRGFDEEQPAPRR
jgi:signal peptidase I